MKTKPLMQTSRGKIRGYFGIGVYHPKTSENIGTLWRSAYILGADFIFTIGRRFPKQASDTTQSYRHIPMYEYVDWADFEAHTPYDCQRVIIELAENSKNLTNYVHPERAVYILGAEDYGIPEKLHKGNTVIEIPATREFCHNVSVAGSLVMFDRQQKATTPKQEVGDE